MCSLFFVVDFRSNPAYHVVKCIPCFNHLLTKMRKIWWLLLLAGLFGCDQNGSPKGTITIKFAHKIDAQALTLSSGSYTNAAGNVYRVQLLEYIVSNLALKNSTGVVIPLKDYQYITASDAATQTLVIKDVPADHYAAFNLVMGIPKAQNTTGNLPNQTNFNNMEWPAAMGGGYHYMRLEGKFQDTSGESSFAVHSGPNGGTDYSVSYSLPFHVHLTDGGAAVITLTMNVSEWLKNPNTYNFKDYPGSVMGNHAVQALLQQNGTDVFSVAAE